MSVTLASMLLIHVDGRPVKSHGLEGLNGLLGPVVVTPSAEADGQGQAMRLVSFTHDALDTAFVLMLPEPFVQHVLDYYDYDYEAVEDGGPLLATEGFVALPDDAASSCSCRPHRRRDRAAARRRAHAGAAQADKGTTPLASGLRRDPSDDASEGPHQHNATVPGFTILHTRQTGSDSFAGLNVGLSQVGDANITLDTDLTQLHSPFRVVASWE